MSSRLWTLSVLHMLYLLCPLATSAQITRTQGVYLQLSDSDRIKEELPQPVVETIYWQESYDPKLVELGEKLFEETCIDCHEAKQALDKRKTYDEWMSTIVKMARQEDADIPQLVFVPIATYLSSLGPPRKQREPRSIEDSSSKGIGQDDSTLALDDAARRSFDPKEVAAGRTAFRTSCLQCHDAERALEKRKSLADWITTVQKMAGMDDAEIATTDIRPIAIYLASLGSPADENDEEAYDKESKSGDEEDSEANASSESEDRSGKGDEAPRFNAQDVARGQAAFQASCTKCHDADRSLSKKKSLAGWLATVRRMSRMDDADVSTADIRPIATYLASLSSGASTGGGGMDDEGAGESDFNAAVSEMSLGSGLNVSGTLSTLWRGGNDNLENPNFFADAWVRLDWQPDGPVRARVTSCTSCHSDQTSGGGFTLELVEAVATYDLMYGIRKNDPRPEQCKTKVEAEIKAGRFVVPFGAYHAMNHPGVYRTVTNPLMFNMGRQVNPDGARPPVLPMPYSDEGVDLHAMLPLCKEWKITLDGFAVNGLQGGGSGVNYTRSRSYTDNNRHAGYGGRATVSNKKVRVGGSLMAGRLEDEGANPLNYHLVGGDATARILHDNVRLYFEYALRRNDSVFAQRQISYGIVSELEVLLLADPSISALFRYDTLEHRDFFGESSIERFTWGVSTAIAGTTLILNHEHWNFPTDEIPDVDVLGIRWVATF